MQKQRCVIDVLQGQEKIDGQIRTSAFSSKQESPVLTVELESQVSDTDHLIDTSQRHHPFRVYFLSERDRPGEIL